MDYFSWGKLRELWLIVGFCEENLRGWQTYKFAFARSIYTALKQSEFVQYWTRVTLRRRFNAVSNGRQ